MVSFYELQRVAGMGRFVGVDEPSNGRPVHFAFGNGNADGKSKVVQIFVLVVDFHLTAGV